MIVAANSVARRHGLESLTALPLGLGLYKGCRMCSTVISADAGAPASVSLFQCTGRIRDMVGTSPTTSPSIPTCCVMSPSPTGPSSISRPGQLDLNCVCLYQLRQPDSGLHLPYQVSNLCTHRTIECTYKTAMASQTRYYVKPSVAREFTWQSQGSSSQGIRRVNSYEYMGHFFGEHMMDRRQ